MWVDVDREEPSAVIWHAGRRADGARSPARGDRAGDGRADPRPRPLRRRPDGRAGRRPRAGLVARRRPDLRLRRRAHVESLCWLGAPPRPGVRHPPRWPRSPSGSPPRTRICSSIIGRADAVLGLWDRLGGHWGPARDVRPHQPLLVADASRTRAPTRPCGWSAPTRSTCSSRPPSRCTPRRSASRRCVDDGGRGYRRRVAELVPGPPGVRPRSSTARWSSRPSWRSSPSAPRRSRASGSPRSGAARGSRRRRMAAVDAGRAAPGRADGQPLRQRLQRAGPPGVRPCGFRSAGAFATVLF